MRPFGKLVEAGDSTTLRAASFYAESWCAEKASVFLVWGVGERKKETCL